MRDTDWGNYNSKPITIPEWAKCIDIPKLLTMTQSDLAKMTDAELRDLRTSINHIWNYYLHPLYVKSQYIEDHRESNQLLASIARANLDPKLVIKIADLLSLANKGSQSNA